MSVLVRGRPGIDVYDESTLVGLGVLELDFAGAGVSTTLSADGLRATVTIPGGGGGSVIKDTDGNTLVHTEMNANEDKIRMQVAGTLRYLMQTAQPHHDLTGDLRLTGNAILGAIPSFTSGVYAHVGNLGTGVDSKTGLVVDMGGQSAAATNNVVGVAGRAVARNSTTIQAIGLDYLAGVNLGGLTVPAAAAVRGQIFAGPGTITDGIAFRARTPTHVLGTLTNAYGFYADAITWGSNRYPFYDAGTGASGNTRGNVFKTNTVFFGDPDFGNGAGVLAIRPAATAPSANPSSGIILYVDPADNKLKARGPAGTITVLANP
jgi:hypothetical protein